ncbi:MAG TPA: hydrogen peroxide-dependent heme synthase [Candidatus Limnocylindria bacterium]|nr:hydrogen peroxide-dependent heme synthase [Candidatus Limnocylindria bacterium]
MAEAPTTLEGWYTLHDIYAVDWPRWNALSHGEQAELVREASEVLGALEEPADGHGAAFSLLSQKGDLCLMHWRRTLEDLRRAEVTWAQARLRSFLVPTYSYLAVIELGGYELSQHAAAMVARAGTKPGDAGYEAAVRAEMERIAKPRLYPAVPPKRYCCFYPMSKRRGEQVNWYDLSSEERAGFMKGHGEIGRKYAGTVVQVIQGSVGFDDWEWGVTLFADDPLVFKKLVYEMRFDPASSRFALFGPFYVGIRFPPRALDQVLSRGVAD